VRTVKPADRVDGENQMWVTHGNKKALMVPVYLYTDKGRQFSAFRWVGGGEGMKQNCHGYAFGVPYWVDDAVPVYQDEYEIVEKPLPNDLIQ